MSLTVAFDFDGTYAADPDTFRKVVRLFQQAGHTCFLITNRPARWGEAVCELVDDLMPIVFAGNRSKYSVAAAKGYQVDIWIDDRPDYVYRDGLVFHPPPRL